MRIVAFGFFAVLQVMAVSARAASSAEPSNPLVSANPEQPNGDWERHPIAVHVPIGLSWATPYGALDGNPGHDLASNAGTFTNFELGVGLRVRRVLVDALMFSIGGAGLQNGPMRASASSDLNLAGGSSHGYAGLGLRVVFFP